MIGYYTREWESLAPRIVDRWCFSFTGRTGLHVPSTTGSAHGTLSGYTNNGNDAYITRPDKLSLFVQANQSVNCGLFPRANFTNTFSVCCWLNIPVIEQDFGIVSKLGISYPGWSMLVPFNFSGKIAGYWAGANRVIATTNYPTSRWFHAGITFDGSVGRVYLDGKLDASANTTVQPNAVGSTLWIGRYEFGQDRSMKGYIDDVIISGSTFTDSEMNFICEQGRGGGLLYQPERRKTYFVPPVTGWKSYWFRNQQLMIGGGIR
jgi:hypothetical protein